MSTAHSIRRAVPADAPALAEFAARTFEETFGEGNDPAHMAEHLARSYGVPQQTRELSDPGCHTLLLESGDALAGYAQVRRHPAPPCVTGDAPVELARFYLDRPFHGSGLARPLMAAVASAAAQLGGRTVWLGVWERNPRAIAFYTKCGFRDAGSTEFFVGPDRQTDRVLVTAVDSLRRDATVYDFSAETIAGETVSLGGFRGRVLLIVNTASACGYTPQYAGLEELNRRYRDRGFAVLGFPCDQFGGQEPGDNAAIQDFCSATYGVTFPLFAKIEVNGPGAHPLFRHLVSKRPGLFGSRSIKWNFTKFLADRAGVVRRRYGPRAAPASLEGAIVNLLDTP
jgi:glutathione peroxidase